LCQECEMCEMCGVQIENESYKIENKRNFCKSCYYTIINKDFCKVCYVSTKKTGSNEEWVECNNCNYWIHAKCDKNITNAMLKELQEDEKL